MRLEYGDLRRLGASVRALAFYSEFDDISAYEKHGKYSLNGVVRGEYADVKEMIRVLEKTAREYGY